MTNPAQTTQRTPFLRVQRNFPQEPQALSVEINRSYVDIANSVNQRTIGIFPINAPVVTGENWFINGESGKQQTLRQVYTFTSSNFTAGVADVPHGINLAQISGFTKIYGTFVDTNGFWYPLPYTDVVSATNQVNIVVESADIVITAGAGSPPAIVNGFVVLEWLANT